MIADLFAGEARNERLGADAMLLRGFALAEAEALLATIAVVAEAAPFRRMATPGGRLMSAEMTNAGEWGWTSGPGGYAYRQDDPLSGTPWPSLPPLLGSLATRAADAAGFRDFHPDGCLINRYARPARMGLHQDRDEHDLGAPIVSVSLGLSAVFLWGGPERGDRTTRWRLDHGDVVVWGGVSRPIFHGVDQPEVGAHPLAGAYRYNLTFRRAR